jgi:hypothetical protein
LNDEFKDVTEVNACIFLDAMRKKYEALEEIPVANIILNSEVGPYGGVVSISRPSKEGNSADMKTALV